jgi:protein-S-isoprenylcysteine O-methyltransferase Ste14
MNGNASVQQLNARSEVRAGILKRAVQIGMQLLIMAGILFISSGQLDWWMAWVYLAIFAIGVAINAAFLMRISPELIAERGRGWTNPKGWDKALGTLWGILSLVALLIAGLNMRFGWPPQIPPQLQLVAVVFVALGSAVSSWAMISNAFFAGTVRIQEERGHTAVSQGPYRFVRHPGYAGWMLSGITLALMLGSLWALVPAGLAAMALVVRTALEDRTLREELDGYSDYAQRVRYRLVPGIW